jgi:hypothetical protein
MVAAAVHQVHRSGRRELRLRLGCHPEHPGDYKSNSLYHSINTFSLAKVQLFVEWYTKKERFFHLPHLFHLFMQPEKARISAIWGRGHKNRDSFLAEYRRRRIFAAL